MILRVSKWAERFETHRTRILRKLDWVPVPNDLDSYEYIDLIQHENGVAHLGAWLAIVQIASKCETRGLLLRAGKAHDAQSLSRISRIPVEVFEEAIPRLLEIGWLETGNDPKPQPNRNGSHTASGNPNYPNRNGADTTSGDLRPAPHDPAHDVAMKEGKEGKKGRKEGIPHKTVTPKSENRDLGSFLGSIGWRGGIKYLRKASAEQILAIERLPGEDVEEDDRPDSLYAIWSRLRLFGDFWDAYWRHVDKKTARIAYCERVGTLELHDRVMAAIDRQSAEMLARPVDKRPYAASWLRAERWTDATEEQAWPANSHKPHNATPDLDFA